MSREKQIDIITDLLIDFDEMGFAPTTLVPNPEAYAIEWRKKLTEALQGYRKQSEGEWEQQPRPYEDEIICTACGANFNIIDNCTEKFNYCPNCGARMKSGAEQ